MHSLGETQEGQKEKKVYLKLLFRRQVFRQAS